MTWPHGSKSAVTITLFLHHYLFLLYNLGLSMNKLTNVKINSPLIFSVPKRSSQTFAVFIAM